MSASDSTYGSYKNSRVTKSEKVSCNMQEAIFSIWTLGLRISWTKPVWEMSLGYLWKKLSLLAPQLPLLNIYSKCLLKGIISLQWRHNGRDSVSNHQPYDCLLNHLFRHRSKKTSKLRVTGLCAGYSPGTSEFPAQMASNAENASIWWSHHAPSGCTINCSIKINVLIFNISINSLIHQFQTFLTDIRRIDTVVKVLFCERIRNGLHMSITEIQ